MMRFLEAYWWLIVLAAGLALWGVTPARTQARAQRECEHCGTVYERGLSIRCPECDQLPRAEKRRRVAFWILVILGVLYAFFVLYLEPR